MPSTDSSARRNWRDLTKRLGWLTEAQAAAGWGVILVLAALLGAIYLNQASKIAAIGRQIQIDQNNLEELRQNNDDIERRIAEAQSIERLQREAVRLGFIPAQPENITYMVIPEYPQGDEPLPVEATPAPEPALPPTTMLEALGLALRVDSMEWLGGIAQRTEQ